MSLKFRDFRCQECGLWQTNKLVKDEVKGIECDVCGGIAIRMLSAPKCFQNTTGKSPSASSLKT